MGGTLRSPWLIVAAAIVAVAVGIGVARRFAAPAPPPTPPEIGGYVLPTPRELPAVALVDDGEQPFAPADFAGSWSFLYFGYTYCPDICPLTLVELASTKKALAEQLPDVPVAVFLVSVDPARDTPARLREYVRYFDPTFRGVTGNPDDLLQLATVTGSVFLIPPGQGPDNYLVSHSSNVTVLDPDGRLAAVITPPHEPAGIAGDFAKLVAYRNSLAR
jgi:protein SCO1/2